MRCVVAPRAKPAAPNMAGAGWLFSLAYAAFRETPAVSSSVIPI